MIFNTKGLRVFVYNELIDMRCGFEKLSHFARDKMKQRLDQGHLYLFFGKNRKRLKALYFDGTGLVLVAKRIERCQFMSLLELDQNEISISDLKLIFHGSVIKKPSLERSLYSDALGVSGLPKGLITNFKYERENPTTY